MPLVGQMIETTSDNFGHRVRKNHLLVDKTLMIKEFFEGQDVSLILRPRRSGKSLNMSMLQHFFAAEVAGEKTTGLFDKFAIAKVDNGQFLAQHQGKYPAILISFKDSKRGTFLEMVENIRGLVVKLYREHEKILLVETLSDNIKERFQRYLDDNLTMVDLEQSLSFLSEVLFKAYGKQAMIFIDEYDTPLTQAYVHQFLDELGGFLRNMLSAALKSNPYLEKGLMTGILRVSKNEMLSGLNNLRIYSLFESNYSAYYGFTETEVMELAERFNVVDHLEEIRAFYNGYLIDQTCIYNPWSLMHYLDTKELAPYWVITSNDQLLKQLFLRGDEYQKDLFSDLMQGKTISARVLTKTRYEELMENPDALWTLLLFTGYLTAESKQYEDTELRCQLKIPNREILAQYKDIFQTWLTETLGRRHYPAFLTSLLEGKVEKFTQLLSHYLIDSLSFRDVKGAEKAESFYHGFTAGLIASIRDTHWVDSNKESGYGLYDVMITPKDGTHHRALILEFKQMKKSETLDTAAELALQQIEKLEYATVLQRYPHITHVLKVGLAFSGKEVRSVYKEENLLTRQESPIAWTERQCKEEFD